MSLARFACDIERHASARSPATLEFRREYPAEQLVTIWQFVARCRRHHAGRADGRRPAPAGVGVGPGSASRIRPALGR